MKEQSKRDIRIASVSGAVYDRIEGMTGFLDDEIGVDAIVGDWLSEINIATLALDLNEGRSEGYEKVFLDYFKTIIEDVDKRKIKVITNAGGFNPKKLAEHVKALIKDKGLNLSVAYIEGDNLTTKLPELRKKGHEFKNLDTDMPISTFEYEPLSANAYIGGWGIVSALRENADIIICGRITDATSVIALSAWWHHWAKSDFDRLAGALIAGHLIECTTYVSGGNYNGFRSISNVTNIGYPIAEIASDGTFTLTKVTHTGGIINRETVLSQLAYEIQGPYYANPDVTAMISDIQVEEVAKNRVKVFGISGMAPPPTAKVGITAMGGYAAELHWFPTGLDINGKVDMLRQQSLAALDTEKFSHLSFDVYGTAQENPSSLKHAMVHLRVFAQAKDKKSLSRENFLFPILNNALQSYPGATWNNDLRLAEPRQYVEYWPAKLDVNEIHTSVHLDNGKVIEIDPPYNTSTFKQYSIDSVDSYDESLWGDTVSAPLGSIVFARSGDKATNCNIGFFVRHEDEWRWLKTFLSNDRLMMLLGDDYDGCKIDRLPFQHIYMVHFLLHGYLKKGVSSTSSYDGLGKNVAEYLRSKIVDIPVKFLERGRID